MRSFFTILFVFVISLPVRSQLVLVSEAKSAYSIVIPEDASAEEQKASEVLQLYLREVSGAQLEIVTDKQKAENTEICIGRTNRGSGSEKLNAGGFVIKTSGKRLLIYGTGGKSALYGVYHFLENYLGCRKFTAQLKFIPGRRSVTIPAIADVQDPVWSFRNVYYPDQYDEEFRDWHKLDLLEDQFGLWGHSHYKLVPPAEYFKSNPEYFALVNGKRSDTQLCLSNPSVFTILTRNLNKMMAAQPGKMLWSVSQNDGFGYCTCSECKAIDDRYGGPQGSVILFANKVAAKFPGKTISTLAYLYSARPPVNLKPAANVSVMLSSIGVDRSRPIAANPRTSSFRNDLEGWSAVTDKLMIWDYVVQFTNYQSPFPNVLHLADNMNYFAMNAINGIFIQGTEGSPGEFSSLKTYLLAKSAWDPADDLKTHSDEFIKAFYGPAGEYIKQYIEELSREQGKTNRILDIYGDPVREWNSWLRPEQIETYSAILDKASAAAGSRPEFAKNVEAERLALEYAVLQQARFYGIGKHGLFLRSGDEWSIRPGFEDKVRIFLRHAREAGVKAFSEGGPNIEGYAAEWADVFRQGPVIHEAIGASVKALTPYSDEYRGKGVQALTDGSRGYDNFQYNYLGWHGSDMEIVLDLGRITDISTLSAGFLEDQRHWSFLPLFLTVETSADNKVFDQAGSLKLAGPEENYDRSTKRFTIDFQKKISARYIRFKAVNLKQLPAWRDLPDRKSWLFCDEIAVFR